MNCTHPHDKDAIECIKCTLMWIWNIVIYCNTCRDLVATFEDGIGELIIADNPGIPIVHWDRDKYISRNLLINEYNRFHCGMGDALTRLKQATAASFGLSDFTAFLIENDVTHGSQDPIEIEFDRSLQRQSIHVDEFKLCGAYVNELHTIKSSITDAIKGISITGMAGKYVHMDELETITDQLVRDCNDYVAQSYNDGNFPSDFNPRDHRSVRDAIDVIVDRQE
jgi:hypothetical protein